MNYDIGGYVVYNGLEICQIGETVTKDFTGTGKTEYITLYPTETQTTIYIPTDKSSTLLRPLLTKDRIMGLIRQMSNAEGKPKNDVDFNFHEAAKNGDYEAIISMMHEIYVKNRSRAQSDKSFFKTDKKIFDAAKKLIDSEFAFVLGINAKDVESFINSINAN